MRKFHFGSIETTTDKISNEKKSDTLSDLESSKGGDGSNLVEGILQSSPSNSETKSIHTFIPKRVRDFFHSEVFYGSTDSNSHQRQPYNADNIHSYHLLRRIDFFHSGTTEMSLQRNKELQEKILVELNQKKNPIQIRGTSLYYLPTTSRVRRILFDIVHNSIYETFTHIITLLNLVLYIIKINSPQDSALRTIYFYFEIFFILFVGLGILFKILALGFIISRYSFLRSSVWNTIDFFIILCSILFFYWLNISVMRALILFSLVDNIAFFTPLKAMIYSISKSISLMRGTLVFLFFTFFVFGMTGVDLFHRSLSRICTTTDGKKSDPLIYCAKYEEIGFKCPNDMICVAGLGNPNNGLTSFDNIFNSLITVFQITSLSNWTEFYYALVKTESPYVTTFWFLVLIFLVTFVCTNMFVVAVKFIFVEFRNLQFQKTLLPTYINAFRHALFELPQALSNYIMHRSIFEWLNTRLATVLPTKYTFKRFKFLLDKVVHSYFFDFIVSIVIVINFSLVLLGQLFHFSQRFQDILDIVLVLILIFYSLEIIFKLLSFGFLEYLSVRLNQLDFILIVVSVVARVILYTNLIDSQTTVVGVHTLSILPMCRFFGVLYRLQPFQNLLNKVSNAALPTLILVFFLAIIILAFSTLAHQLFGFVIRGNRNYDTIVNSFISLFIILTGDSWQESMYQGALISPTTPREWLAKILSIPFFLFYWFVSNVLLVSLFIAIVLESFNQENQSTTPWTTLVIHYIVQKMQSVREMIFGKETRDRFVKNVKLCLPFLKLFKESNELKSKSASVTKKKSRLEIFFINSLQFRKVVQAFVLPNRRFSKIFSFLTTATAIIGIIPLFFETSTNADLSKSRNIPWWLMIYDYVCLLLFSGEFSIQFFALGFEYFLNPFNDLEVIILAELILSCFMYPIVGLEAKDQILYGALRGFRAFRPLKLLAKLPDFSIYLNATFKSVYDLLQVSFLAGIVTFLYALLGYNLFAGMHEYCTDRTQITKSNCNGIYINAKGIYAPRTWITPNNNFNNLESSILTLFEVSTRSLWSEIMWPTIYQRNGYVNKWSFLFFLFFLLTVTYFILNLIIAVIQSNVDEERGMSSLTPSQRSYLKLIQDILHLKPERKKQRWSENIVSRSIDRLLSSPLYKLVRVIIVAIACVCLAIQYGSMSDLYKLLIGDIPGYLFVTCVACEQLLNFLAYGPNSWWKHWNRIEVCIIVIGIPLLIIFVIFKIVDPNNNFLYLTGKGISRSILLLRIFRVGSNIPSVGFMLQTLVACVPSIFSTLFLLVIIMFAYSIFGMAFFGNIKFQYSLNGDANYRSLFNSMMVLFRVLTVDTWNNFLYECKIDEPFCTRIAGAYTDCGSRWSPVFYISFILIGSRVILNLFIGILIDNFSHTFQDTHFSIRKRDLKGFIKVWKEYDPRASGYLSSQAIRNIVDDLYKKNERLGLNLNSAHERELFWVMRCEVLQGISLGGTEDKIYSYLRWDPVYKIKLLFKKLKWHSIGLSANQIYFNDVLIALCRVHISSEDYSPDMSTRRKKFLLRILKTVAQAKIQNMINDRVLKMKFKRISQKFSESHVRSKRSLLMKAIQNDFKKSASTLEFEQGEVISLKPDSIYSSEELSPNQSSPNIQKNSPQQAFQVNYHDEFDLNDSPDSSATYLRNRSNPSENISPLTPVNHTALLKDFTSSAIQIKPISIATETNLIDSPINYDIHHEQFHPLYPLHTVDTSQHNYNQSSNVETRNQLPFINTYGISTRSTMHLNDIVPELYSNAGPTAVDYVQSSHIGKPYVTEQNLQDDQAPSITELEDKILDLYKLRSSFSNAHLTSSATHSKKKLKKHKRTRGKTPATKIKKERRT